MTIDWDKIEKDKKERLKEKDAQDISDFDNISIDRAIELYDEYCRMCRDEESGMWNEDYALIMAKFRERNPWLSFKLIQEIKRLRELLETLKANEGA